MADAVVLEAPAKLTLSLRITGVRPDGYHLIDAEMVTLTLSDTLEIAPGDGLRVHGPERAQVETGPENLVLRALRMLGRTAQVTLTKRIPAGAGLGGGSADAAAVLRWAGYSDVAAAADLGADVPFCLVGGRARVRGIGEIVEPLPYTERTFTLLIPPFGCSTPEVYRRWDELGGPGGDEAAGNDLQDAALDVEPRLAQVRDSLEQATGQPARLAGSGSTWFVEGAFPGGGRRVVGTAPAVAR